MTEALEKSYVIDVFQNTKINDQFILEINWGKIEVRKKNFWGIKTKVLKANAVLDLGCVTFNSEKKIIDIVYHTKYNSWLIQNHLPLGKTISKDKALQISNDQTSESKNYKRAITIFPERISSEVNCIMFFIHLDANKNEFTDFSMVETIHYSLYKMNEKIISSNIIQPNAYKINKHILKVGKMYLENGKWKFMIMDESIEYDELKKHMKNY